MEFHVGAWITRDCFVSARRDDEGCFTLKIPLNAPAKAGKKKTRTGASDADWPVTNKAPPAPLVDILKLQLYVILTDPETQLTKPFPLAGGLACLRRLCKGQKQVINFQDPNSRSCLCNMTLQAVQPLNTKDLGASVLWRTNIYHKKLRVLSSQVMDAAVSPQWQVPNAARDFMNGLSYLPNGGSKEMEIPPINTHFAAYGGFLDGVDRNLPHAMLAYYLQLVVTQHGLSIQEANGLPDRRFAQLAGSVLGGLTNDADGCPYQYDRSLAIGLVLDSSNHLLYGLKPVTSEDIGLPFAQSTYIGRDFTPQARPDLRAALAENEPRRRFEQLAGVLHARRYASLCRAAVQDDCETSATACMLAKRTVASQDMSPGAFRRGAVGYTAFANWTGQCFEQTGVFFTRLQGLLRSGKLNISTVVGLAGGAKADSEAMSKKGGKPDKQPSIDDPADLGGHCYCVLRFMDNDAASEEEGLYVCLLEGTTCMRTYRDRADGPLYTVSLGWGDKPEKKEQLPMTRFLSLMCDTVSLSTQVITTPIDAYAASHGVSGAQNVPGFVRSTAVMKCLHSLDRSSPAGCDVPFYKWCVYTGVTGDPADLGVLPIDELEYSQKHRLGAGCRPAALADPKLRGLALAMTAADRKEGSDVLDEVWPPMADEATFKALLNLWETLPPLVGVNEQLGRFRRTGVSYATIACMESPASPALVDVVFEINRLLAEEANRINLARPDSDGIFLTVDRLGTGVTKTLHVPEVSQALTFCRSLKEAKAGLGWPVPPPEPNPRAKGGSGRA